MSNTRELLTLQHVSVDYAAARTRFTAIQDISLTVGTNEFVTIVGPSGCGKSTLLKVLGGLVPLAGGSMSWSSSAGAGTPRRGDRPATALVFQSPRLLPWRSVLDNVAFGLQARKVPKRAGRARAAALLERVGLMDFARSYPHQLSGGMQQRVNLARALAVDPDLILLDEPFAALDAQTRESMQEYLSRVWFNENKTALMVTHQPDEAVFLADRVVVLSARPAQVMLDLPVKFERPRTLDIKRTAEFREIEDRLHDALRQAVQQAGDVTDPRRTVGA